MAMREPRARGLGPLLVVRHEPGAISHEPSIIDQWIDQVLTHSRFTTYIFKCPLADHLKMKPTKPEQSEKWRRRGPKTTTIRPFFFSFRKRSTSSRKHDRDILVLPRESLSEHINIPTQNVPAGLGDQRSMPICSFLVVWQGQKQHTEQNNIL